MHAVVQRLTGSRPQWQATLVRRTYTEVTIKEAANGAEGLRTTLAQPPDLIISDCHRPLMDGFELVGALRSQGASLPILMLSSEENVAKAAQLAGATAFLTKPLAIRNFSQFLLTLLPDDTETRCLGE